MQHYRIQTGVLERTFKHFRECGAAGRECQVLWISPWAEVSRIAEAVHVQHRSHAFGFEVESEWLNGFWLELASRKMGVRVQVHTHPGRAFHSETDDKFPIVHVPGFLSLVIPSFGRGQIGFDGAYLARLTERGEWQRADVGEVIEIL